MKKYILGVPVLILVAVILVIMVSIFTPHKEEENDLEGDIYLYYVSQDGFSFNKVPYEFVNKGQTEAMADEVLEQLKQMPGREDCQPSVPKEIMWSDVYLENENLIIDFTAEYFKLEPIKEIFLRASVVKSLTQIEEIRTVEFKVTGTPLMSPGNQPVGMMNADHFIDGIEENWGVTQEEKTTLYFADKSGTKLVQKQVELSVVNNIPMEQLVIEALIHTDDFNSPIPADTTVLKAITKDQICYVDLSKEFLNPLENISREITVYAIVNSLCERPGVSKVQFSVEGKTITNFVSNLDLSMPISRNLDLIQK